MNHIQEIDDNGDPIIDIEVAEEDQAPPNQQDGEPLIASPEAEEGFLSDIDPDHNSLLDLPSERLRECSNSHRKKSSVEHQNDQGGFDRDSGPSENINNNKVRAAVGPVPSLDR